MSCKHRWMILVLGVPLTASAQPADPPAPDSTPATALEVSASFFARYEIRENFADLGLVGRRIGELDGTAYRARLGLTSSPIPIRPGWHTRVELVPQASGFWGDVSGGLTDAGLGVHEANVAITGERLRIEVGRFEMAYGDQLVIGDVGWHETGRAFDGARARLSLTSEGGAIDVFATQVAEGATLMTSEFAEGDAYFLGVYGSLGDLIAAERELELDAYLLGELAGSDEAAMPPTEAALELTGGVRVKDTLGPTAVRVEAGVQTGQRPASDSVLAAQIDGDVMFAVAAPTRIGAGAFYATGDDPTTGRDTAWNQLYPTAHKFLGFMDIIGPRTNVAGVSLKGRHAFAPALGLGVDGHVFFRPETAAGVDTYTGFETDVWLGWKIGGGLGLRGQYSLFAASADGPFASDAVAHYVELQLALAR